MRSSQSEAARIQRLIGGKERGGGGKGEKWPTLNEKACAPAKLPNHAMSEQERKSRITSVDNFTISQESYLVVYPRMGLGNTLCGYKSSFVFSLLSGRRLVVFSAKVYKQAIELLCQAYFCNGDVIFDDDNMTQVNKLHMFSPLSLVGGVERNLTEKLYYDIPVMTTISQRYFDDYWFKNRTLRHCVFKSLDCETKSCVYSRAMRYFLNGPRNVLSKVMKENLQSVGKNQTQSVIPDGSPFRLFFDVAVQIRTLVSAVEGSPLAKKCEKGDDVCFRTREEFQRVEDARQARYLSSNFWGCLANLFAIIRRNLVSKNDPNPILNIFLATDNEFLRPKFVNLIRKNGVCYFSSGKVEHTTRGNSAFALPTFAEFELISRSNYLFSYRTQVSTFGESAAQYGNCTVITYRISNRDECTFQFDKRALQKTVKNSLFFH